MASGQGIAFTLCHLGVVYAMFYDPVGYRGLSNVTRRGRKPCWKKCCHDRFPAAFSSWHCG